jgi:serine protease Do
MHRRRRAAAPVALLLLAAACAVDPSAGTAEQQPTTSTAPAPPPAATASLPDIVERLTPSVVTVNATLGSGSGVVYRPDIVLTNAHVVGDAEQVTIGFADGTSSPGEVLATDRPTDLAIVRTARNGLPVPR